MKYLGCINKDDNHTFSTNLWILEDQTLRLNFQWVYNQNQVFHMTNVIFMNPFFPSG